MIIKQSGIQTPYISFFIIHVLWKKIPVGGCILDCFVIIPTLFLTFCRFAIPTSCNIFNAFITWKLIRWRFVTHGGIDGYSRTVVFLRFSTHSEARTVFSVFTDAVQERDLPDSVWTDLGRENVDIWCYMVEQHSSISAVITACYAHNERIEHLWLEEENQLDCLNEIGLFRLHQLGFCTVY